MTRKEFLSALRQTPRDWYVDSGGRIRRDHIEELDHGNRQCPISSLDNAAAWAWPVTFKRVNLSTRLAENIVHAADVSGLQAWRVWRLRRQIKRACGL